MYGWLTYDEKTVRIMAVVPAWATMRAKVTAREFETRARTQLGNAQRMFQNKPTILERLSRDLTAVLQYGPDLGAEVVGFAACMCVAHHALTPERRDMRTATIQRVISLHFGERAALPPAITESLVALKSMAMLIPDATLEDEVRSACLDIALMAAALPMPPDVCNTAALRGDLSKAMSGTNFNDKSRTELIEELISVLLSRPPGERPALRQMMLSLPAQLLGETVGAARVMLSLNKVNALKIHRCDFMARLMEDVSINGKPDQWSLLIDPHLAMLTALNEALSEQVLWASIGAVVDGMPMGAFLPSSKEALRLRMVAHSEVMTRITPARSRNARQLRAVSSDKLTEKDAEEMDMIQSMSIDQLVRWIEGPVARPLRSKAPAIDRKAIVTRERQKQKLPPATDSKGKTTSNAPPLEEADVHGTILDALSQTARFFLDDIGDMLTLTESLKIEQSLAHECGALMGPLSQIANQPADMAEDEARDLLSRAEVAVKDLRKGIEQAKASALVQLRFPGKLKEALNKEALVPGKRHGGQINCPVQYSDWAFVNDNFHGRWLPGVTSVLIDGKPMPLDSDQAAAWYVTFTSQSGFAFNVSVHLWRRRPGCTGLPSLERGVYPPMNEAEWFDTFIPCCVLHVPLGTH